ncbi:MAG TPA: putative toxin-antitoxin system toxin component, PIN family, partial [Baekduia sp.]|nr:putative toxin-antitoxin system toxin component, PIN family [Baekduia sp.]
ALISRTGSPAELLRRGLDGEFEVVVSPLLRFELERVLSTAKLRSRISAEFADRAVTGLVANSLGVEDPEIRLIKSPDPDDDYLIALASSAGAALVSGDKHLLGLEGSIPVYSPAAFRDLLDAR